MSSPSAVVAYLGRNMSLQGTRTPHAALRGLRDGGLDKSSYEAFAAASRAFRASCEPSQWEAIADYTGVHYSIINGFLRYGEEGVYQALLHDNHRGQILSPARAKTLRVEARELLPRILASITALDGAFLKAPSSAPRILYKAFRVWSETGSEETSKREIRDYIATNYALGDVVHNLAYTSTSVDSDYMLVHARRRASQIVVMEILTDKGIPLNNEMRGSVQEAEREVLLPRNMRFEITGHAKTVFQHSGFGPLLEGWGFSIPQRKTYSVIQMTEII